MIERPQDHFVYFIQAATGGLIKIGWAIEVKGRLSDIQKMSPVPLVVLFQTRGGRPFERHLHLKLASSRHHGEWFHPSKAVLAEMERLRRRDQKRQARAEAKAAAEAERDIYYSYGNPGWDRLVLAANKLMLGLQPEKLGLFPKAQC